MSEKPPFDPRERMEINLNDPELQKDLREYGVDAEALKKEHEQARKEEEAKRGRALSEAKVIVGQAAIGPIAGRENPAMDISMEDVNKIREQIAREGAEKSKGLFGRIKKWFGKG